MTCDDQINFPHQVVLLQVEKQCSLIAAWREYRNMTPLELAGGVGITVQELVKIEEQGINPRDDIFGKLAKVLDVSVDHLRD